MSVKDLAEGVRKLQMLQKSLSDVDFQERILDLRTLLNETQEELLEREDTIRDLRRKITKLEDTLSFSETLVEENGFKYRANEKGEPVGYPYCPKCETKEREFYQLFNPKNTYLDVRCANCKTVFGTAARLRNPT